MRTNADKFGKSPEPARLASESVAGREARAGKRERWRGVDGNRLHFELTWFGQGKKVMGMQLPQHQYPIFDHGTNLALIILENQGGGKCNL